MSKAHSTVTLTTAGKFKQSSYDDLPDLPDHYGKKLAKVLNEIIKPRVKQRVRLNEKDIDQIREAFFMFFVSVFQKFGDYLDETKQSSEGVCGMFNY